MDAIAPRVLGEWPLFLSTRKCELFYLLHKSERFSEEQKSPLIIFLKNVTVANI